MDKLFLILLLFAAQAACAQKGTDTSQVKEKNLDTVIINTGYQQIPKERATGSFTSISKALFNQQAGPTVLERLEAISNGLYVDRQTNGTGGRIVIRGLSTIQGPRAPLIVLDDFPYEGDLNNINPNDVENITILKDAAAASIWGTRAGNGVIVITTKKGRYEQPLKVEFNTHLLLTEKPDLSYHKDISVADQVAVERFLYGQDYYTDQLDYEPWLAVSPVVELLKQRDLGNITAAEAEAGIAALGTQNFKNDLSKYVYQKGINTQAALTVRGGSRNMAWMLGGGWDGSSDPLDNRKRRVNFRSSQAFKLTHALELTTGIDYTQTVSTAGRSGFGQLRAYSTNLPVYTPLADAAGKALPVMYQYRKAYTDRAGGGKLLDWNYYPLTDPGNIDNADKQQAMLANIGLNYKLTPALSIGFKYQYGKQISTGQAIYNADSYLARYYVNLYSVIDPTSGNVSYTVPKGGIRDNTLTGVETQNIRGQANYTKRWGNQELTAIGGTEYRQVRGNYSSYRSYGYDPDVLGAASIDFRNQYPDYFSGNTDYIPENLNYGATLDRYISFYANAAYTYKNKYTFSASGRRDASNLFGATSNDRWKPLWSTGLAWDISRESFYKISWLPVLKLRASYGSSGNADASRSAVTTLTYGANSPYTQTPTARISHYKNPGLKWETVHIANIGLDLSTAGAWLQGSLEYYAKRGTDLFGTSPVDYTSVPTNAVTRNVASMAGYGVDLNISTVNTKGKLSWASQLNFNFNRDKVLKYYLASQQGSNFTGGQNVSALEGRPVYALYGFRWAGLDAATGDPQGYIKGVASTNYFMLTGPQTLITDLDYIGPTLPTLVASLGNTISWKNISLTLRLVGKFGNYFQRRSIDYGNLFDQYTGHPDYGSRWQKPGDEAVTNVPSLAYPNNTQRNSFYRSATILASKADFIRLQYVTVAYELKRPSLQAYINFNNLGILWRANRQGIDPEYQDNLPPSLNIAVGIRANF